MVSLRHAGIWATQDMLGKQLLSHEIELSTIFEDTSRFENVDYLPVQAKWNSEVRKLAAKHLVVNGKEHDL